MIKYSLILNSRDRPDHLASLLLSVIETTNNLAEIEMMIGLDKDDPTLQQSIGIVEGYPFVQFSIGERPTNLIHALNNLAALARGDYLFVLNDDVVFLTQNWDSITSSCLAPHAVSWPDGILYGRTYDLSVDRDQDGKYAAFPIISKKARDILDFCIPPMFFSLGGDVAAYRIYEEIDRVVDLPNIVLRHTLHQTLEQVLNPDQTAFEMRQQSYAGQTDWKIYDIAPFTNKLKKYIANF